MTPELKAIVSKIGSHIKKHVASEIAKGSAHLSADLKAYVGTQTVPLLSKIAKLEQRVSSLNSQVSALIRDAKGK